MDLNHQKTQAINLRMSAAVKGLLRSAAEREHRTLSNMLEVLILEHCLRHSVKPFGNDVADVSNAASAAKAHSKSAKR